MKEATIAYAPRIIPILIEVVKSILSDLLSYLNKINSAFGQSTWK